MRYPTLYTKESSRQMVDVFKGYNHNLRIGDGEFFDMKNMTSDHYPVLSPRGKRGVYATPKAANGLIAKDALCYVDGTDFVMNEYRVDMGLTSEPKTLVSMGAYVIILPDKKYINTADIPVYGADITDYGSIEAQFPRAGAQDVTFSLCTLTGAEYENVERDIIAPEDTTKIWLDTSATPHVLKQYASASGMWVTIPTTYVKIASPGIGADFAQYDGVTISGIVAPGLEAFNGTMVVQKRDSDYIVVIGILDKTTTQTASQGMITIKRQMPTMDFVIECKNRLWGCRYGTDINGNVVNEIYCSKLGDFKNWNCFMGISTDSYAASVGTDGQFTGAITHGGFPLFFKEGCLHKVYGDYPANFSIQDLACRGVQKGSSRSLAIVNEVLYYKSKMGVCAYDGSLPLEISAAMGDAAYFDAVAGAHGNKYYISMADSANIYHLFVYDSAKRMWNKEDNLHSDWFCTCGNELYFIDHADGNIKTIFGSGTADTAPVEWMIQTGIIGTDMPDKKYISRLNVRMSLEVGSSVIFSIEYDSSGIYQQAHAMTGTTLMSFNIPLRPRRCDHLRLKIEGSGPAKVFSITKTIEQGSDLR